MARLNNNMIHINQFIFLSLKLSLMSDVKFRKNNLAFLDEPITQGLRIGWLDSNSNYKQHIHLCSKIVSHKIYLLSKIRRFITEDTAIFIFKPMIAPIIDYGDIICMGGSKENLT